MPFYISNQEGLLVQLTTIFGDSDIFLKSLTGKESISKLFEFRAVFQAKDSDLDLGKALGTSINICFKSESHERYIDGIISEFSQGATGSTDDEHPTEYDVIIRPCLWLLTLDRNSRIFQNKTTIDIVKQILSDRGVADVEDKTQSCGKAILDFCTQYDESSFNFVSRLMEKAGIFYFFRHEKNKHTLVLADSASAHAKPSGESKIEFAKIVGSSYPLGKVFDTRMTMAVNTGGYSTSDYNYTVSQTDLFTKLSAKQNGPMFYEYPGGFGKLKEGEDLSKLRVQFFESSYCVFHASSTAISLAAGFLCEVERHPAGKFNGEYMIFSMEFFYEFSFSHGHACLIKIQAIKKGTEFRPPIITPRPHISGTQTAIVTCPSGEEVFRNEHCSVKIHFHWDQNGKKDDTDSCWVRVAQTLVGNGWGGVFTPRIGQEVVVTFIDGDPDRPLIVGCVYNDKFLPPYSDQEAMISSLKTVTYTDDNRFQEIKFNDEKDKEEFSIRAQRDMAILVWEGNRSVTLQSDKGAVESAFHIVEGNHSSTIDKGNFSLLATEGDITAEDKKGNASITLDEGNCTIELKKGELSITIKGGGVTGDVEKDYSLKIGGNLTIKADGDISIEAGKGIMMKAGQDFAAEAGAAFSAKGGTDFKGEAGTAMTLKGGTDFKAESGTAMALNAGVNCDIAAQMNVSLKGQMQVEIAGQFGAKVGGLQVEVAGQAMTKISAPMIQVGGGMVQLG